ncbi:MAG TPA: hypothetical protein VNF99_11145 [Stellaceae bacterium]|nr:hypothetical protein [Stellaceae bacterium]
MKYAIFTASAVFLLGCGIAQAQQNWSKPNGTAEDQAEALNQCEQIAKIAAIRPVAPPTVDKRTGSSSAMPWTDSATDNQAVAAEQELYAPNSIAHIEFRQLTTLCMQRDGWKPDPDDQ